jgi:hypothetical protein
VVAVVGDTASDMEGGGREKVDLLTGAHDKAALR